MRRARKKDPRIKYRKENQDQTARHIQRTPSGAARKQHQIKRREYKTKKRDQGEKEK
jgi:hypothetical protein